MQDRSRYFSPCLWNFPFYKSSFTLNRSHSSCLASQYSPTSNFILINILSLIIDRSFLSATLYTRRISNLSLLNIRERRDEKPDFSKQSSSLRGERGSCDEFRIHALHGSSLKETHAYTCVSLKTYQNSHLIFAPIREHARIHIKKNPICRPARTTFFSPRRSSTLGREEKGKTCKWITRVGRWKGRFEWKFVRRFFPRWYP